jgi:hypothetical protein
MLLACIRSYLKSDTIYIYIFLFWHISPGNSVRVFTWARIWGSVITFRSQEGFASNKVWETLTHINTSWIAVNLSFSSDETEALHWTKLWVTSTHSLKPTLPFSSTFSAPHPRPFARLMQNFEIMPCLSCNAYLNIFFNQCQNFTFKVKSNCKANPIQAWLGPEGSRSFGLPDFITIGTWMY